MNPNVALSDFASCGTRLSGAKLVRRVHRLCGFLHMLQNANGCLLFQVLLPFSPVSGVVPLVLLDNLIKIVVLLGTTFVSFILIFNLFEKWVLIAISLITTIATVVDRVYKFGVKNRNMAIILEKMEQEYMLHNSSIGSYKSFGEGTALDIFMDRIDQLRQERSKLRLDHEKTIEDRFQKLEESSKDLNR